MEPFRPCCRARSKRVHGVPGSGDFNRTGEETIMARAKQGPEPTRQEQDERNGERRRELSRREQYPPTIWSGGPFSPFGPFRLINRFTNEMERMFEDLGFGRGLLTPRLWGEPGRER